MDSIRRCLSYSDVLLVPRHSSLEHLSDADIVYNYDKCSIPFKAVPVINAPMDFISRRLINILNKNNLATSFHRWFKSIDELDKFYLDCGISENDPSIFIAVGNLSKWKEWIDNLIKIREDNKERFSFLIDVANGDTKDTIETIKYIRGMLGKTVNIMAGNIATKSAFCRLQEAGADFIRVGIGGGSICSTRTSTGFGVPTLTSIFECSQVKDSAYLVADGGIEYNGDIIKAMAAGADMVMAGKLFAATDLSCLEKFDKNGEVTTNPDEYEYCSYHGMASKEAIQRLKSKKSSVSIEGVSGLIPYTGATQEIIENLKGNMQSAMAYYAGCKDWNEFQRKVKFIEITSNGWEESKTRVII